MQKPILTILFTLFSQTVIAQTSFDEPELDINKLEHDVKLTCLAKCTEQFNFNLISFDSILKRPVGHAKITSGYGWRKHPILKRKKFHHGIDFSVPVGTPVKAGQAGVVVYAGWMSGYGRLVVIKHDSTYSTVYGHLNHYGSGIKVGSFVTKGQVIAKSGNSGRSTGPHLHYEIRANGLALNPDTGKANSKKMFVINETEAVKQAFAKQNLGIYLKPQRNGRSTTVIR